MKIITARFSQKGFSLIEVILVVLVVGAISALVTNLPSSIKLIGNERHESLAKDIGSKRIEDLRSLPFDNLINSTTQIVDSRLTSIPQGAGSILIEDCPPLTCKNSEANIKQATVTINWVESGKNQKIKIVTLISKGGLR